MKYPISYAVRTTRAPGETKDSYVPVIIDRVQATDLSAVVENCIDRGLITGMKPTAAQGIAEGIAEQIAREFSLGRGVSFGQFFYGRPYLTGKVDTNGRLTSENAVNIRLYKGNGFKLALDDFAFSFDGSGDLPKVDFIVCDGNGVRGEIVTGASVKVNGRFLNSAGDTNKVYFEEVGGVGVPIVVDSFTAASDNLLAFASPAGLVAGRAYEVTVERIDPNGVTRTANVKRVTVKAGAAPADPPEITRVQSDNEPDGTVNVGGAFLEVSGQNILDATEVKLYNSHGTLLDTVPMERHEERADTIRSTRSVAVEYTPEGGSETGSLSVTTDGGSDTHAVTLVSH